MARVKNNPLTEGLSGAIGKEIVFRKLKNGTFSGKYPDMSAVVGSKNQTKSRNLFAEAVAFAKAIMNDPEKSAAYKKIKAHSLYHAAVQDYMQLFNPDIGINKAWPPALAKRIGDLNLSEKQLRAIAYLIKVKKITNGAYQKLNTVSKATATRHLKELQQHNIIQTNGGTGAGAYYTMGSK